MRFFLVSAMALGLSACASVLVTEPRASASGADCVVLLHGLARGPSSMRRLARSLNEAGYRVHNHSYASRQGTVARLADAAIPDAVEACAVGPGGRVHFVTHSMGGILLRHYLDRHGIEALGRTVMLSPPNQGSELVDRLSGVPGFGLINGPAGRELGTSETAVPARLGPARFEVGVIAGGRSLNPVYSLMIPGRDDGKVSIERARLAGMADFIVMPHSHTWIMRSADVIAQVRFFLHTGRFDVSDERSKRT